MKISEALIKQNKINLWVSSDDSLFPPQDTMKISEALIKQNKRK